MQQFNQPELSGPGGAPIYIPRDTYERLKVDIENDGAAGDGFIPLDGVTDAGKIAIEQFERSVKNLSREHVRVFSPDGIEVYRKIGGSNKVSVDLSLLRGNVVTHNHPQGMPLSLEDVISGLEGEALEVRAVTSSFSYAARFTEGDRGDLVLYWAMVRQMAVSVAREWHRSNSHSSDEETYRKGFHAAWMELARRGFLEYRRIDNV